MAGLKEFYCQSNETSLGSQFKWLEYTFKIRDPRSWIREKAYSGSRIQGSKNHRIPDLDPQHCLTQ